MKDLIVVATSPGREMWVKEIMGSISRPCIVVSDLGYELGKIRWVLDNTSAERFILLQDSMVIRDESLFDKVFNSKGSACIYPGASSCFNGFVGLYERRILEEIGVPICNSKEESVLLEQTWTKKYVQAATELAHPVNSRFSQIETLRKFGRENKVCANQYYEKWYGTWSPDQVAKEYSNSQSDALTRLQLTELSMRLSKLEQENQGLKRNFLNRVALFIREYRAHFRSRV